MERLHILFVLLVTPDAFALLTNAKQESGRVVESMAANPRLFFLGTVGGKSYFSDNTTSRSWSASKTFCLSTGMKLATITTAAQYDFLRSKGDILSTAGYWTDARDALTTQQFVWDEIRANVTIGVIASNAGFQTALTFGGASSHFHIRLISSDFYVLCETF